MKTDALAKLTAAALALPTMANHAQAATSPHTFAVSYQATHYKEDAVATDQVYSGDPSRYTIDVQQLRVVAPINSSLAVILNVQDEVLTGASPWYVDSETDPDRPIVMSGASIKENRTDGSLQTAFYHDDGSVSVTAAVSNENDYHSTSLGIESSFDLNQKHSTISVGFSGSDDTIKPTQGNVPTNTLDDTKQTASAFVGFSQIINKHTILQFGTSVTRANGFLSDPYKFNDRRPDSRQQWTANLALRQHYSPLDTTLHLDYRYFGDDWDMQSHTLDTSVWIDISENLTLIPSFRWYSQQEAPFFANTADSTGQYHSSDYRLSSYGATTYGLRGQWTVGKYQFTGIAERYESSKALSAFSGDTSPTLVSFTRISAGIQLTF